MDPCLISPVSSVIPALERLRQKDLGFQASLSYKDRPCLKKKTQIGFRGWPYPPLAGQQHTKLTPLRILFMQS
jgi:hypothetical protein